MIGNILMIILTVISIITQPCAYILTSLYDYNWMDRYQIQYPVAGYPVSDLALSPYIRSINIVEHYSYRVDRTFPKICTASAEVNMKHVLK